MLEAPVPIAPDSTLRVHLVVAARRREVDTRVRACVPRPQGLRRRVGSRAGVRGDRRGGARAPRARARAAARSGRPSPASPGRARQCVGHGRGGGSERPPGERERLVPRVENAPAARARARRGAPPCVPSAARRTGSEASAVHRPGERRVLVRRSTRHTASSGRPAWCARSDTIVGRPCARTRRRAAEVSRPVGPAEVDDEVGRGGVAPERLERHPAGDDRRARRRRSRRGPRRRAARSGTGPTTSSRSRGSPARATARAIVASRFSGVTRPNVPTTTSLRARSRGSRAGAPRRRRATGTGSAGIGTTATRAPGTSPRIASTRNASWTATAREASTGMRKSGYA